jgi:hypothetical protein
MGNRCNDYYLLLVNQELERIEGIGDLQERSSSGVFSGAPVEFSVELRWNFRWSSGGAPVDVRARGLSEDPLKSGAAVS